jgi:hypothetical protein
MSKNQIIVIVILLASALLLNLITKEDHTPVEMKILFERVVSSVIDETTIDEIEIYKGKDLPEKTLFRRSGEVWIYPDKFNSPLMKQKITDLVKTLNSMEGQVRSEDPNLVGEYMLGERESIHLVFNKGGQPLLHLLMGMKGSGWQTCFVRQKDSGKVYFVDNSNPLAKLGVYTRAVDGTIDGNTFVDKNLMTMREELKKVTLKTADREICVELVEEALPQEGTKPVEIKKRWTLPSHPDLQADEKKIAEWVGGLKSLWVQDYIDPALKDSYQLGTMTVTLEGAN